MGERPANQSKCHHSRACCASLKEMRSSAGFLHDVAFYTKAAVAVSRPSIGHTRQGASTALDHHGHTANQHRLSNCRGVRSPCAFANKAYVKRGAVRDVSFSAVARQQEASISARTLGADFNRLQSLRRTEHRCRNSNFKVCKQTSTKL